MAIGAKKYRMETADGQEQASVEGPPTRETDGLGNIADSRWVTGGL